MSSISPVVDDAAHERPLSTLRLALWFGLLAGLGEIALLAARKYLLHRLILVSREAVWMAPLADVILFLLAGVLLIALRVVLPRRLRPPTVLVFAALASFTLLLMYQPLYRPAAAVLALGIGTVAFRMARRWTRAFAALTARSFPLMVIAVLVATAAVHIQAAAEARRDPAGMTAARAEAPDVLFIVLDTVRSWNLSAYGYARQTTPEIERWMRDGVRFEHALSTAPWTLPSHASMFTGRFPHELSADWLTPLDTRKPTLAEVLRRQGYETAGFVANTLYCSYETGLARGFSHYEDYVISMPQIMLTSSLSRFLSGTRFARRKLLRKSAQDINDEFLHWLDARHDARPYFAFLNYMDAHDPYQPPPPYDRRYSAPGADKLVEDLSDALAAPNWPPEVRQAALDKYDESLTYLDHQLGQLFAELERRGKWKRTLVVLTADHGEEFGERGLYFHGNSLYRGSLEVPLFLRLPATIPGTKTIAVPVSLKDIAATVLEVSGARPDLPGRSLARYWRSERNDGAGTGGSAGSALSPSADDALLMELNHSPRLPGDAPIAKGPMKAVLQNNLRLIRNGDGREELYDFANDRTDSRDLAALPEYQAAVKALRAALETLTTSTPSPGASPR